MPSCQPPPNATVSGTIAPAPVSMRVTVIVFVADRSAFVGTKTFVHFPGEAKCDCRLLPFTVTFRKPLADPSTDFQRRNCGRSVS